MKESKNIHVQTLLDALTARDSEKSEVVQALRAIVFRLFPNVTERVMYGGVMFSRDFDFGGVFVSKNHVSFEFGDGHQFDDPRKLLEGSGKFRRHLKIRSLADVLEKEVEFFVVQAGKSEKKR